MTEDPQLWCEDRFESTIAVTSCFSSRLIFGRDQTVSEVQVDQKNAEQVHEAGERVQKLVLVGCRELLE